MSDVSLPLHVGIIMDGNGRWASQQGKDRSYGHKIGAKNVERIVSHAFRSGIKVLTLYAFSAENWARPKNEVDSLMKLLENYFKKYIQKVMNNNVRINVIGDTSALTIKLQKIIRDCIVKSQNNTNCTLNIAINYGGRQEIVTAVKKLIEQKREISVENISSELYTAFCGDPDLIIRTGGEYRLSNFLLFQGAYSELYFTDVFWPDFDEIEFDKAIESFKNRKRRFGTV